VVAAPRQSRNGGCRGRGRGKRAVEMWDGGHAGEQAGQQNAAELGGAAGRRPLRSSGRRTRAVALIAVERVAGGGRAGAGDCRVRRSGSVE
jgi:hypothetical protein